MPLEHPTDAAGNSLNQHLLRQPGTRAEHRCTWLRQESGGPRQAGGSQTAVIYFPGMPREGRAPLRDQIGLIFLHPGLSQLDLVHPAGC